jgi:hypothetical protein
MADMWNDPLLDEARDELRFALVNGDSGDKVKAIEALLDAKIALAIEAMADKVAALAAPSSTEIP